MKSRVFPVGSVASFQKIMSRICDPGSRLIVSRPLPGRTFGFLQGIEDAAGRSRRRSFVLGRVGRDRLDGRRQGFRLLIQDRAAFFPNRQLPEHGNRFPSGIVVRTVRFAQPPEGNPPEKGNEPVAQNADPAGAPLEDFHEETSRGRVDQP